MRSSPRNPLASLVALVALLALVATSCGGIAPYAVRVNGVEISRSDFEGELEAIIGNAGYMQALEASGATVRGDGSGTFDTSFVADVLSVRVILELIRQAFERRDLEVGPAVRELADQSVAGQVGGPEVLAAFDEDYRQKLLRRTQEVFALQLDLAGVSLAEEDLRALYREQEDAFAETCVSHILVSVTDADGRLDPAAVDEQAAALEARAEELRASIEAGADFATVAEAESADTQSAAQGGDLGCAPPGQYVPEFEEAVEQLAVDELSQPVRTQFGYHLILVTDRRAAPFEETVGQLRERVLQQSQEALQRFIQEGVADADVEVNPRYGSYQSERGQVVPPEGPTGAGQRSPRAPTSPVPLP